MGINSLPVLKQQLFKKKTKKKKTLKKKKKKKKAMNTIRHQRALLARNSAAALPVLNTSIQ